MLIKSYIYRNIFGRKQSEYFIGLYLNFDVTYIKYMRIYRKSHRANVTLFKSINSRHSPPILLQMYAYVCNTYRHVVKNFKAHSTTRFMT